jgi:flagellar biosynthetic protein FliO
MDSVGQLPGLGGSLAVSLVSLGVVCLIAYVSLRFLSRRGVGVGGGARGSGPIKILARYPLDPRRALYLVETAGRCFLVGVGDGPMTMLAELGTAEVAAAMPAASESGGRFADVLGRVLGRRAGSGPP